MSSLDGSCELFPPRERSRYLATALEESLAKREAELIKACELANQDPEVAAIEREMDALTDPIEGAWN